MKRLTTVAALVVVLAFAPAALATARRSEPTDDTSPRG